MAGWKSNLAYSGTTAAKIDLPTSPSANRIVPLINTLHPPSSRSLGSEKSVTHFPG